MGFIVVTKCNGISVDEMNIIPTCSRIGNRGWSIAAALAFAIATTVLPARAKISEVMLVCQFDTFCLAKHGCNDRQSDVSVLREGDKYKLDTPGLTFDARLRRDEILNVLSFVTPMEGYATHLLTIYEDGEAMFTAHARHQHLVSVTQFGKCTPPRTG